MLLASLITTSVSATPPIPFCTALDIVLESDSRLVVELGPFAPPMYLDILGMILVPPSASGEPDEAKHWLFEDGVVFDYGSGLRFTLDHNISEQRMQEGDLLVIEGLSGSDLPQGTWLLFLIHEPTGASCLSLTWVLGNVQIGQHLPFTSALVTNPMEEYGFASEPGTTNWTLVALVLIEAVVLGLILVLISRIE